MVRSLKVEEATEKGCITEGWKVSGQTEYGVTLKKSEKTKKKKRGEQSQDEMKTQIAKKGG